MKTNEILIAMHLLLANNVFSPANLKELLRNDSYDSDSDFIQQLKSMYDSYAKEGKLICDEMLQYFPGSQVVIDGDKTIPMNMLQFAKELEESENDPYCVQTIADCLGQCICFGYDLSTYDEQEVTKAILDSDPVLLSKIGEDINDMDMFEFIDKSVALCKGLIGEMNYIKRNERKEIVDPGTTFRNSAELDVARATRAASYARFSLAAFGQVLAMLYPIMVVALAETNPDKIDFMEFIYDLRLIEMLVQYNDQAHEAYGTPTSENVMLAMMKDDPTNYFDPDDEPDDDESNATLGDFKNLFPEISKILYEEFYIE